jgi:hypothetical protein
MLFELVKDEEGYPPADVESLWVKPRWDGLYEIDNIPFFAKGVSVGDVVSGDVRDGALTFRELVHHSGHSTIRVIVYHPAYAKPLRAKLKELGSDSEQSHLPSLVAVDIPRNVSIATIKALLELGVVEDRWEYEEAAISHKQ